MMDIESLIGVERVKQTNTEISYENLTKIFDGRPPSKKVLDDVVYQTKVIFEEIKSRKVEGERTKITELEIKKLAFLYRMTYALRRFKLASKETIPLEEMKWLENER